MDTIHDPLDRKLKRVKINLLRNDRFAFWRGIMMVGDTVLTDEIPTAMTDGCNEYYGREFVEQQDEKQVAFGMLHENWHKLERHLSTYDKLFELDPQICNMACDYRINLGLVDLDPMEQTIRFPTTPDGKRFGLLDERFRGMNVLQIFRILKQEQQQQQGGQGQGQGGQGQSGAGQPGSGNFDDHDWGNAKGRGKEEQDKLDKIIDQAIRRGAVEHAKINGKGDGAMDRLLGELTEPKIDWRELLAEFVRSICNGRDMTTWRKVNRRFLAHDMLMPSMISERIGHVVVGVDTSGSITGKQINVMLSEVVGLAKEVRPDHVDLLYWDCRVAGHEEYDETNIDLMATSTKPAGGGGTSPACVKDYLKQKHINPECVIMLTDGYVDSWPDFDCPVLWVVTTKKIVAATGQTIHLDDN
jgi:predicted metal-dependent peptidase